MLCFVLHSQTFLFDYQGQNGKIFTVKNNDWIRLGQVNPKGYKPTNANTNICDYSWGRTSINSSSEIIETLIFRFKNRGGFDNQEMHGIDMVINGDTLDCLAKSYATFGKNELIGNVEYTYFCILFSDQFLFANIRRNNIQKIVYTFYLYGGKKVYLSIPQIIYK